MSSPQFLNPPEGKTAYKDSLCVILPVPFEKTTSFMRGTGEGPRAILEASHYVEFYDPELEMESWEPALHTLPALNFEKLDGKEALEKIESQFSQLLKDKKFPIALGGEHTLSGATIAAAAKQYPNLSVLQIDAHADLRASYEGTPYSHACAMRLATRYVKKITGVGIRSVDAEEVAFVKEHPGCRLFYDQERSRDKNWIEKVLASLSDTVFLTIDVDGFDPSLIPATGTPEPGGLSWYEGLDLIRALFQQKKVVAGDVVELLPMAAHHASSFITAKLVYKLIGYWKKFQSHV